MNRERGVEGCVGVGRIALFGWRLSLDDVSIASIAARFDGLPAKLDTPVQM